MKNYSDVSVTELEKSVHQFLQCQENISKLESKLIENQLSTIKAMMEGIAEVERILSC